MKQLRRYIVLAIALLFAICSYAQTPLPSLSRAEVDSLGGLYFRQALESYAQQIDSDWQSGSLKSGDYQMPFAYSINGEVPQRGYPLYISLHGGGAAEAQENDKQWENQKVLYGVVDGVYFVPRSPTNSWNMWHQEYMDDFLFQVVTYAVARLKVDPLRVYLLGYSAGGDGVYNLASRLSDRFAAAAMMAGHPGDAQIENLRNLPFAIYVGANDTAYDRAGLALEWAKMYEKLNGDDKQGFEYRVNIYGDKGHWMDGLDGEAIGWLAEHSRVSTPNRVIWIQDDVLHTRRYNLEVSDPKPGYKIEQRVDYSRNTISIYSKDYKEVTIWLDDYLVDLEKPVVVQFNNEEVFNGMVARTEQNIIDSITGRIDSEYLYWGRVDVKMR